MPITGEMLIGALAIGPTEGVMRALDPAVNAEIKPDLVLGGATEVDRAAPLADDAFDSYSDATLLNALYSWSVSRTVWTLADILANRASLETRSQMPFPALHNLAHLARGIVMTTRDTANADLHWRELTDKSSWSHPRRARPQGRTDVGGKFFNAHLRRARRRSRGIRSRTSTVGSTAKQRAMRPAALMTARWSFHVAALPQHRRRTCQARSPLDIRLALPIPRFLPAARSPLSSIHRSVALIHSF